MTKLINSNIVLARKMRSIEKAGYLMLQLLQMKEETIEKATEGKLVEIARTIRMDTRDIVKILGASIVSTEGKGRAKAFRIPHIVREFAQRAEEAGEIYEIMSKGERKIAEAICTSIYNSSKKGV